MTHNCFFIFYCQQNIYLYYYYNFFFKLCACVPQIGLLTKMSVAFSMERVFSILLYDFTVQVSRDSFGSNPVPGRKLNGSGWGISTSKGERIVIPVKFY